MPKFNTCRTRVRPQVCILYKTYLKPRIDVRSHPVLVSHFNEDLVPVLVVPITCDLTVMIIELGVVLAFPILGELLIIIDLVRDLVAEPHCQRRQKAASYR
jgi:hypothetical protein